MSAITGLVAKENVVGTFGILYGFGEVAEDGAEIWGTLSGAMTQAVAYSFLVFNLLCAPCFANDGSDQTGNEQREMVLVCDRIPDIARVYSFTLCVSDRNMGEYRSIWRRNHCGAYFDRVVSMAFVPCFIRKTECGKCPKMHGRG